MARPPALDSLRQAQLRDRFRFDNIIGRHSTMQHLFSTLELVAPMNSTVLIQGETGTGKELIARAIHRQSRRSQRPFVAVNCTAIPEHLMVTLRRYRRPRRRGSTPRGS
jgi:transcriptional regulator with PAS, ATPase and Fis domain